MKRNWGLIVIIFAFSGIVLDIIYGLTVLNKSLLLISAVDMVKYFTIQSNVMVIIYFLMLLTEEYDDSILFKRFFGGVVIYIMITFIVWAISLESLYELYRFEIIGNVFLHYATPIIVFGFLIKYRKEYDFNFKDIGLWLVYPLFYLGSLIIHGIITDNYLYPFFQVRYVGVDGLIKAIVLIIGLFILLSLVLVKVISKSKKPEKLKE
jgi:hypothetical protein